MAKVVAELPAKKPPPGRPAIYAWDEWLNGDVWLLERGVDVKAKDRTFQNAAIHAASKRGLRVVFRWHMPEGIFLQAHKVIRKEVLGRPESSR